ncbi:C1 family peptidase [Bdellovibrio sp. HCB274]|uniref:C1 family peptidase n=1 Tax=Bdellovibrio sp. HCB274 TaxID=3394361 RepID=UPI0039B4CB9D
MVKASCAPFDQFVSKIGDPQMARDAELKVLNDLKKSYKTYGDKLKKSKDDAQDFAESESKRLGKDCGLKTSQEEILAAFGQTTYEKFLDLAMVPEKCWDIKNQNGLKNMTMDIFPTLESKKKTNYKELSGKIQEVLATGRPVVLAFCAQEPLTAKSMKDCKMGGGGAGHEVPIVGFSKACDKSGKCVDLVKVHNSWGANWQKTSTDDGWVEAKKLLDRSFYGIQSISWVQDKEKN